MGIQTIAAAAVAVAAAAALLGGKYYPGPEGGFTYAACSQQPTANNTHNTARLRSLAAIPSKGIM